MTIFEFLQQYPSAFIGTCSILGLLVGSFLNVVIYRLPVMMKTAWRKECKEFLELKADKKTEVFNLMLPNSHCPKCNGEIQGYQNIPVISYLFLGGKCANCRVKIPCRYPIIEALTGLLSGIVAWQLGYGYPAFFGLILTWVLISLSMIDIDEFLLPDSIVLPTLWLGLTLSLFSIYTDSQTSLIGAIAGYLSLWLVFHGFKLLTGKEGMGYGDFKLLALFGAWLGWQYLPTIILLSSLVGAVIGSILIVLRQQGFDKPIPFGPYLAAAGWICLLWGQQINQLYLDFSGL